MVFFAKANKVEVQSDYDYHIRSLFKVYQNKGIKLSMLENRNYINGEIKIDIDSSESFAMILINEDGEFLWDNYNMRGNFRYAWSKIVISTETRCPSLKQMSLVEQL